MLSNPNWIQSNALRLIKNVVSLMLVSNHNDGGNNCPSENKHFLTFFYFNYMCV